jgi:hypothetical protein
MSIESLLTRSAGERVNANFDSTIALVHSFVPDKELLSDLSVSQVVWHVLLQ